MPGVQHLTGAALDDQLRRVADQLGKKFSDRADSTEVTAAVYQQAELYRDARVTQYIPVLVQHAVQEQLRLRPLRPTVSAS